MSLNDRDAVIVDYARSAMGRSKNGCFRNVRADDISVGVVRGLLARNEALDVNEIDGLIWGCVLQRGEQGMNLARNIVLRAQLPFTLPAQTVNRLCGSSMSALQTAAANVMAGLGGRRLPGGGRRAHRPPADEGCAGSQAATRPQRGEAAGAMGMTAQYLAMMHGIGREQQDKLGLRSHQVAHKATVEGKFAREIIPIEGHDERGALTLVEHDETIRPETTLEGLAALPRPSTRKALKRLGLTTKDIDMVELNEAFAAQALPVLKDLELLDDLEQKVNGHGGTIALGRPFGCSGTRITGSLLNVMEERDLTLGVATIYIGLGQGITTVVERV